MNQEIIKNVLIFQTTVTTLLSLSTYILVSSLSKTSKEVKTLKSQVASLSKKKSIDFDKDFKMLNDTIEKNVDYFIKNLLKPLLTKYADSLMRDEDIQEIIITLSYDIRQELSEAYVNELLYYISDIDKYIIKRLNEKLLPYFVALNVNKLH